MDLFGCNWPSSQIFDIHAVNQETRNPILFTHLIAHATAQVKSHRTYGKVKSKAKKTFQIINEIFHKRTL